MVKALLKLACFFNATSIMCFVVAVEGTFKDNVSPLFTVSTSFITPTLIATISSSTFSLSCPLPFPEEKKDLRSDSFFDLNAWKFGSPGAAEGRVTGAVVDSDEWLIFTPHFGQNMKLFSKPNPQEEQNEIVELEEAMMSSFSRI